MKKILVIESQPNRRNFLLEALKAKGFYTISAENGQAGIQQAKSNLPDLISCGTIGPELDGYSILTTLRQNTATAIIPFIFVTETATHAEIRKGMELGANDFLVEPFTLEDLLRAFQSQLEKQAALWQSYTAKLQTVPQTPSFNIATVEAAEKSNSPLYPTLKEVMRFIEANYYQPISLSDVAQALGYSASYLTNLMRRHTGQTVQRLIIDRRMAAARSLLLETDHAMEQIATQVGYNHVVYFFRQFRQIHGITPQTWRTKHRI